MEQNILLSKIAATPTQIGWSQAYSTHYLYFVVSLKTVAEGEHNIATLGKDLLEKLQREFFSLEEKKLENIKESVKNSITVIPETVEYSIVVSSILSDILYIVIASHGQVVIKREHAYHIIAKGAVGQVHGFSGKIKHADIIILETHDFATKITEETMKGIPHVSGVLDLSENIAPLIHSDTEGTEAAIFLQYQNIAQVPSFQQQPPESEVPTPFPTPHHSPQLPLEPEPETAYENYDPAISHKRFSVPSIPHFKIRKRFILGFIIVILIAFLGFNLYREKAKKTKKQESTVLLEVLKPAQSKYQEGVDMLSLNEPLAMDDFREAKKMLQEKESQFPEGSSARAEYDKLMSQINSELGPESTVATGQTVFFDPAKNKLKGVNAITDKPGSPALVDSADKKAVLLKGDGSIDTTYDVSAPQLLKITGDETSLFVLGSDGIYQIDRKGSSGKKIVESSGLTSVDVFGTNVYATDGTTINKYGGSNFDKSSYFSGNPTFSNGISDFTIDGAIWIIEKNGAIHKFLKGSEESFKVQGLSTPIGKNPQIYTTQDSNYLYVLDPTNKRLVTIGKDGAYKSAVSLGITPASFSIEENEKKALVVSGNKVYSFDLK